MSLPRLAKHHRRLCIVAGALLASYAGLARAEPINPGDTVLDDIACHTSDIYELSLSGPDTIVAHVTECQDFGGVCGVAAFQFDQCLELRDPTDIFIANVCSQLDGNVNRSTRTRMGPEATSVSGTHSLTVADANNQGRGRYTIFVQSLKAPAGSQSLQPEEPLLANLTVCGEVDTYQFPAADGQRVIVDMTPGDTGNVIPRLELFDSTGVMLSDSSSGGVDVVVGSTGPFTLLAYSETNQIGTYELLLTLEVPPSCPRKGDVDGDCAITPDDALCIFKRYLGQPSCLD